MKTLKLIQKTMLVTLTVIISVTFNYQANADSSKYLYNIESKKLSNNLKINGWKLASGVYMGHAKIAGKYGLGIVVERKSYSWGINNRGISIQKRF